MNNEEFNFTEYSPQNIKKIIAQNSLTYTDDTFSINALSVEEALAGPIYILTKNNIGEVVSFTEVALNQLLNRLGIPIAFYKKNPVEIQSILFNYWANKFNKNLFIRFSNLEKTRIRAVLTPGYSIIDNIDVFPVVLQTLQNENITIKAYRQDEYITQMVIVFNDVNVDYNGERYNAGLIITNSEVGFSSVWIEPLIILPGYEFTNRSALLKQKVKLRIVHRGKVDSNRIRDITNNIKEIAQVGIIQIIQNYHETISKENALTFVKSINEIPNRFALLLEDTWQNEKEIAKTEVTKQIMLLAKKLPLFQQMQINQQASKIIGLFDHYKQRLSTIAEEMKNV